MNRDYLHCACSNLGQAHSSIKTALSGGADDLTTEEIYDLEIAARNVFEVAQTIRVRLENEG